MVRITTNFKNKTGQITLEQLRAIDRTRIIKILGKVDKIAENTILNMLSIMFQR